MRIQEGFNLLKKFTVFVFNILLLGNNNKEDGRLARCP